MNQNAQLEKIEAELARIIHMVDELKKEESLGNDIDLEEIYRQAGAKAWTEHVITSGNEMTKRSYLSVLMGCAGLAEQMDRKIGQYYFVARILRGVSDKLTMEELLQESRLLNGKVYEHLREALSEEQVQALLLDLCVMVSMTGEIEERQQIFLGECFAMFGVSKEQIRNLLVVAKGVLRQEYRVILQPDVNFPVISCVHYFRDVFSGTVITSKENIPKKHTEKLLVFNVKYEKDTLDIDQMNSTQVDFVNCEFEKMTGITAFITNCGFYGCKFTDCGRRKPLGPPRKLKKIKDEYGAIIQMKKAVFDMCIFLDCYNENDAVASILVKMRQGLFKECHFGRCYVNANSVNIEQKAYDYASIICADEVEIQNCVFQECKALGNGWKEQEEFSYLYLADELSLHIIYGFNCDIKQCRFQECICDGKVEKETEGLLGFNSMMRQIAVNNARERNNLQRLTNGKDQSSIISVEKGKISENEFSDCKAAEEIGQNRWKIQQSNT